LIEVLPKGSSVIRRIVSVLVVSAILLATMVATAFAGSGCGYNNQCGDGGDGDLSSNSSQTVVMFAESTDNSINNTTITQTSTTNNTTNTTTTNTTTIEDE
jgi:hypothetical protein